MAPAVFNLALVLLLVGVLLWVAIVLAMARVLLNPERMSDGRALAILGRISPGDLGLHFSSLTFPIHDEANPGQRLSLAAWWIPAPVNLGRCMVLLHGYSDAKVGAIAWAPTFRSLGWNVLAIDLRAHGESEGLYSTAGFFERHDVSQVIDQIRAEQPGFTRHVAFFGVSMGAAVALATAHLRQGRDLCGLILECPFADFASAARTHAEFHRLPGYIFQRPALKLATRMSGADFHTVAPVNLIPQTPCPLMVIHGESDLFITRQDMDAVEAALRQRPRECGPTVYWRVSDTHHVLALRNDPAEYARRVGAFLNEAMAWTHPRSIDDATATEEKRS